MYRPGFRPLEHDFFPPDQDFFPPNHDFFPPDHDFFPPDQRDHHFRPPSWPVRGFYPPDHRVNSWPEPPPFPFPVCTGPPPLVVRLSPPRRHSPSPPPPPLAPRLSPPRRSPSPRLSSERCFPSQYICSPEGHAHSPGWNSGSPGWRSRSRHPESSVDQNLRISLSDMDRDDLADGPICSRSLLRHQSLERYPSHQENQAGPFNRRHDEDYHNRDAFLHQSDYSMNYEDKPRENDREGELHRRSFYALDDRGREPKRPRYDGNDRLLHMNMEPQGFLSGTQKYHERSFSRSPSPTYLNEDFRELESVRRKRKEEEMNRNLSGELSGNTYVMTGSTNQRESSEPQYLYRPDEAPAMSQTSVLKKHVDDHHSVQPEDFSSSSSSIKEPPLLSNHSSLPEHSRLALISLEVDNFLKQFNKGADAESTSKETQGSQDGSGFSRIRDDNDCNTSSPSTQKLRLSDGKESVSQKVGFPLPSSVKPESMDESGPQYEKIYNFLKTIGLDIGVAEIGKLAAHTLERLHGKKSSRSPDRYSGASSKPEMWEKSRNRSKIYSPESNQKHSISPTASYPLSKVISPVTESEHNMSKMVRRDNPQNYPPPTMPPPGYDPYGQRVAYAASGCPMYAQQTDPGLTDMHGRVPLTVTPNPTRPNFFETVSTAKGTSDMKRDGSGLVQIPTVAPYSKLHPPFSQPSLRSSKERIADEKSGASMKQKVIEEIEKLKAEQETWQKTLHDLSAQLNRLSEPGGELLRKKQKVKDGHKDPLRIKVNQLQDNIAKEIVQLKMNADASEKKQSELDKVVEEIEKLKAEQHTGKITLHELNTELNRLSNQKGKLLRKKQRKKDGHKDPLPIQVNQLQDNIAKEIVQLKMNAGASEKKQSELDKVVEEIEKLKAEEETGQKTLHELNTELNRLSNQEGKLLRKKQRKKDGHKDPLPIKVNQLQDNIAKEIVQLKMNAGASEKKQSELDKTLDPSNRPLPAKTQNEAKEEVTKEIDKIPVPAQDCLASWKPLVLICGNSTLFWAGRRAANSEFGTQLKLSQWAKVQWLSQKFMSWEELVPLLFDGNYVKVAPTWLVIHLGGDDIGQMTGMDLFFEAMDDLQLIKERWPDTQLVWSDLIRRKVWRNVENPVLIDKARRRVNKMVGKVVLELGGQIIQHPDIHITKEGLYRDDGVRLTDEGNNIFLSDLQRCLQQLVQPGGSQGV
ncbi:zinc finger protein 318-like isoform X2 [Erythrolamprus reginae]|uniref:zinc finger protein 318-like isoform X2 n=1 Tax=Erythrolamprus reginae TaxID=121349 RepID=UPI00396CB0A4